MLRQSIQDIASVDIFKEGRDENLFIGRPFYLGYEKANMTSRDTNLVFLGSNVESLVLSIL